ncbi:MAG: 16S rRNA (cytosine(1402)-N(4))-methyltransferase RsmH [Patescibacteria group bacterium]
MISHKPVLINQVLRILEPKEDKVFIDCTLGAGGHTEKLLEGMKGSGKVYGIEVDDRNLEIAKNQLGSHKNVHYARDNFKNLEALGQEILKKEGRIDGILLDLGLSSMHIDDPARGFSFQSEGPLDMRFDTRQGVTAAEIINTYSLEDLLYIFNTYGEEKHAYKIAKRIIENRRHRNFKTTSELADFIAAGITKGRDDFYFKRHPATRIFQALRIATNREIEVLEAGLRGAVNVISKGGRIVVISYHSIEDRIVKNLFRDKKKEGVLNILTKKPIEPDEEEIKENRRARSAKLRAAEKI